MEVPEAYIVNIPLNSSFFTDVDGDGDGEEFIVSGTYDEYSSCYYDFGVYAEIEDFCYYEEYYAYDYHPYYVKTRDNGHFLYLFCEEAEEFNRCMSLVVLELADGKIAKAGEMQAGPYYRQKGSSIESEVRQYGECKRVFGSSRYDTSVAVANEFFNAPAEAVLAYAKNFPDGLCGGPLAYSKNAPLILTADGKQAAAVQYSGEKVISYGAVLGGDSLISDAAANEILGNK